MPPYDNAVPQAAQRISASQQPILNNFIEIDNDFARNHVPLTAGANNGKHNLVQFVSQIPTYVSAPVAGEFNIYNKIPEAPFPETTFQELFLSRLVGGFDIPMTASHINPGATRRWSYLPSGWVIKCGTQRTSAVAPTRGQALVNLVVLPLPMAPADLLLYGPPFTQIPIVFLTTSTPNVNTTPHINIWTNTPMTPAFFYVCGGPDTGVYDAVDFTYIAIGPVV